MPDWIVMLLLVSANFVLGWLLLIQFITIEHPFAGSRLEFAFAALTLGISVTGWLALILAELSWFSVIRLAGFWLILVIGLLVATWHRWRGLSGLPVAAIRQDSEHFSPLRLPWPFSNWSAAPWLEYAMLGLWLIAANWLYFRPHEFIMGGADAGVYVNLGASIARSGSILIHDQTLAGLDPALYPALLRTLPVNEAAPYYLLPGFYVTGEPAGQITPQFYPLYPTWLAIAYGFGGIHTSLLMSGLWAVLGSVAVYLMVRQLAGPLTAILALTGLSLNALQVWFARYPTTETLTQYLLWAGLWSLVVWLGNRQPLPLWGLLAGLALGQVFLVRIDTYFLLAVPLVVWFGLRWSGRWRRAHWWFFLPVFLLAFHSLAHALWQSSPYFYNIFGHGLRLLHTFWLLPLVLLPLFSLILLVLGWNGQRLSAITRYRRPISATAIVLLILLAIYAWFLRPYSGGQVLVWNDWYSGQPITLLDLENFVRLGWYLSPVGVWLAVAGMCLLIWQSNRQTAILLGVGLFFSLLYLWRIQANPHQIYAMRRYVPVVMPFFIMAGAYFLGHLFLLKKRPISAVAFFLTVCWLGGMAWLARGFVSQVDYQGITAQMEQLNAQLDPRSVLLFNDPAPVGQGDLLGTPLRFLYGHDVFTLRDPAALDLEQFEQLLQQWQAQRRTVYWIMGPDGYDWPLSYRALQDWQLYSLDTVVLEGRYDRRPVALLSLGWQGSIAEIR